MAVNNKVLTVKTPFMEPVALSQCFDSTASLTTQLGLFGALSAQQTCESKATPRSASIYLYQKARCCPKVQRHIQHSCLLFMLLSPWICLSQPTVCTLSYLPVRGTSSGPAPCPQRRFLPFSDTNIKVDYMAERKQMLPEVNFFPLHTKYPAYFKY